MPTSYIRQNQAVLASRHYVRNATAENHWYSFAKRRVERFKNLYSTDFCLVINGSLYKNDAYVIPFSICCEFFTDDYLDANNRWVGTIKSGQIRLTLHSKPTKIISSGEFYNAFHLLHKDEPGLESTALVLANDNKVEQSELLHLIALFNAKYAEIAPARRIVISDKISRPNAITDYVKQLQNFTCQICTSKGFRQKNGEIYVEAHHINELHQLLPGSYCSDNIIVVCSNCHKMLHYADVAYEAEGDKMVVITINGKSIPVSRNLIST